MRRVTIGKYLAKNANSLAHVQNIQFLQMPRFLTWKNLVVTLICKLKLNTSVN